MSTQSTPQISDFQKINKQKNLDCVLIYEIKWCSLPCSGPRDRQAQTNALPTISRTTANKITILKKTGNEKKQ